MNDFTLQIPTKLIFGRDTHKTVGAEVKNYADKILLVRSSKKTLCEIGIYDDVINSLKENGIEFIELDGIVPNPRLSKVREGIAICKRDGIRFILAVGGGSVVDSAKAIAAGACIDGDYWDIVTGIVPFEKSLPVGTIMTMPATGTEMNTSCVITNDDLWLKTGRKLAHPVFSILNPEIYKAFPKFRIAQSVVDMLAHAMERYFANDEGIDLTDRMLEGVMKTVVLLGIKFYKDGYDYNTVSQIVYAGTVCHNFTLCVGRTNDFASHNISHELSGVYDLSHGEALAIIFPSWIKYVRDHNKQRMAQFFVSVFGVEPKPDIDDTIDIGIETLENFYKDLGMPIRISETNIKNPDIEKMAINATKNDTITRGSYVVLTKDDVINIYKGAL